MDSDDGIYRENDAANASAGTYGDRLTAVTAVNKGTLADEHIAEVSLENEGVTIATATESTNGTWVLEPPSGEGWFQPDGTGGTFSLHPTLADSAPGGETVTLDIPPVSDAGTTWSYDAGDRGIFFAQGPPTGDIGPGAMLTVPASSGGGTSAMDPPPVGIDIDVRERNLTTATPTIPVTVETNVSEREFAVSLRNASTNATLETRRLLMGSEPETVRFETRPGRFVVRVRDTRSGSAAASDTFEVARPPTVSFTNATFSVGRGAIADVGVAFVNAETAQLRIEGPTGVPLEVVPIRRAGANRTRWVAVDTSKGPGPFPWESEPPATTPTDPSAPSREAPGILRQRNRSVDRSPESATGAPNGSKIGTGQERVSPDTTSRSAGGALGAGRYTLTVRHRGRVTDTATLHITDEWNGTVETYVAPAGVNLSNRSVIRERATPRSELAVGDTLVVVVNASGLTTTGPSLPMASGRPENASHGMYAAIERRHSSGADKAGFDPAQGRQIGRLENGSVAMVLPSSANGTDLVRAGDSYRTGLVLTERSPVLAGLSTPEVVESESIGANVSIVRATADFAGLSANRTLDLPPASDASIEGTTSVAPGTVATVRVRGVETNASLALDLQTTVEDDGTYETEADLSEYDPGTDYTVSVWANDERLSPIRSGSVAGVERESFAATGGGGGGSATDDEAVTQTVAGPVETVTTTGPEAGPVDYTYDRGDLADLREDAWEVLPRPLRIGLRTLLLAALGLLAVLVVFRGVRRLL